MISSYFIKVVEKVELLRENKIVAIILAGGKSRRFKKDKARLKIGDKSLTYRQYKKLKKIFKKVYISSKKDKFDFKAKIIYDKQKKYLPIYSLIGLIQKFNNIFIVPVDVPLLSIKSIKTLLKAKTITSNSPFVGVYSRKDLKKLQQNIKNKNYSPRIGKKELNISDLEALNINHKEDYIANRYKIKNQIFFKNSVFK